MATMTITTRTDIAIYLDNSHADFAQEYGNEGRESLVQAIQDADHPAYGTDWADWLDEHANDLRVEVGLKLDGEAEEDNTPEITDEQIRTLSAEAGAHGDQEMVAICQRALTWRDPVGRAEARKSCAAVIAEARGEAERDDEAPWRD
jgi:hypothetical protein